MSRRVVRKVIRSESTEFRYERGRQPLPRIDPWRDQLDGLLLANEEKPGRERLTLIRVFEELSADHERAHRRRSHDHPLRIIGSQNYQCAGRALFADVQFRALKRRWVGVGEIPDGHRWDSLPKIRFAPDSALEEAVTSEPVSENSIPEAFWAVISRFWHRKWHKIARLACGWRDRLTATKPLRR